jgi:hypothetical protein
VTAFGDRKRIHRRIDTFVGFVFSALLTLVAAIRS